MLTVAEVAHELGLSVRGVQNRIARGQLQSELVHPRLRLIPREEMERWRTLGKQRPGRKPRKKAEA